MNLRWLGTYIVRREAAKQLHQRERVLDLRQRAADACTLAGSKGQVSVFLALLGALRRKALRIEFLRVVPIFRAVM